jgi:hypothetical protein
MVSRLESQDSVLTPKEAVQSPFPGGDHLFLATSTPRSRSPCRIARGLSESYSGGGGILCRDPPALLSRFLAFVDVHGHAARSRIPFDLTPRSPQNHVNDPAWLAMRGERTLSLILSPSTGVARRR